MNTLVYDGPLSDEDSLIIKKRREQFLNINVEDEENYKNVTEDMLKINYYALLGNDHILEDLPYDNQYQKKCIVGRIITGYDSTSTNVYQINIYTYEQLFVEGMLSAIIACVKPVLGSPILELRRNILAAEITILGIENMKNSAIWNSHSFCKQILDLYISEKIYIDVLEHINQIDEVMYRKLININLYSYTKYAKETSSSLYKCIKKMALSMYEI